MSEVELLILSLPKYLIFYKKQLCLTSTCSGKKNLKVFFDSSVFHISHQYHQEIHWGPTSKHINIWSTCLASTRPWTQSLVQEKTKNIYIYIYFIYIKIIYIYIYGKANHFSPLPHYFADPMPHHVSPGQFLKPLKYSLCFHTWPLIVSSQYRNLNYPLKI
jgi:hypothetical protein